LAAAAGSAALCFVGLSCPGLLQHSFLHPPHRKPGQRARGLASGARVARGLSNRVGLGYHLPSQTTRASSCQTHGRPRAHFVKERSEALSNFALTLL